MGDALAPVIKVSIDTSDLVGGLNEYINQVPFAASRALNDVAIAAQADFVAHEHSIFDVHKTSFVDKAEKIRPFATKSNLTVTAQIEPPGGPARADIIAKFEDGEVKTPAGISLAIPLKKKGSRLARPRSFNFHEVGSGFHGMHNARIYASSDQRVFMVQWARGDGYIFQRVASRKRKGKKEAPLNRRRGKGATSALKSDSNLRMLYKLVPKAKIPSNLDFVEIHVRKAGVLWQIAFTKRFNEAMASRK